MGELESYVGDYVEVAELKRAGWGWRCHLCDLTTVNLDQVEAASQARVHAVGHQHRAMLAVRRG